MRTKKVLIGKRIMAVMMSALMAAGTVNGAALTAFAAPIEYSDRTADEDAFAKLADYISAKGEKKEQESGSSYEIRLSETTYLGLSEEVAGSRIVLGALSDSLVISDGETSDNRLEVSFAEDPDKCELAYFFTKDEEKIGFRAELDMAEFDENTVPVLKADSEEVSEEVTEAVKAGITKILPDLMKKWNDEIENKADVSLAMLGFTGWFEEETSAETAAAEYESLSETEDNTGIEETSLETTEATSDESIEETADESQEADTEATEFTTEDSEEATDEYAETTAENTTEDETTEDETTDGETTEGLELEAALSPVPVERISLNLNEIEVYVGDDFKLKAYVFPENAEGTVNFISCNEAIATVTADGVITGVAAGDVEIGVSAGSTLTSCMVHVCEDEKKGESNVKKIAEGIWLAGFEDTLPYTGGKVTQNIRVYDGKKLLKEKTDYTVAYANNINASTSNQLKSPSMTITMKGQYSGKTTHYFAISKRSLEDTSITTDGIALTYNKREQKHIPTVMLGTKKLVNKTDYTIEYFMDAACTASADSNFLKGNINGMQTIYYKLTATEKNFTGTTTGSYFIVATGSNLSKAAVKYTATLKYMGIPLTKDDLKLTVTMPGSKTAIDPFADSEYSVAIMDSALGEIDLADICNPGTYTIRISTAGYSYSGFVEKKFKVISGNNIAKLVEVDPEMWLDEIAFDKAVAEESEEGIIQPDKEYLRAKADADIPGGNTIVKGTDYTVIYSNNRKAGTAKVTFKGTGRFTGSISKTFRIVGNGNLTAVVSSSVTYLTGGAVPEISVTDENGTELIEKKDYTVTLKNNKAVGTASYKITGKGNYAKSEIEYGEGEYTITPSNLQNCSVVVADKPYVNKAGAYKSVPVIYDTNGKKLVAGKDYDKNFEYFYPDSETNDCPDANTTINIGINGLGNFEGSSVYGKYKIYDKLNNIAKLQIVVDTQEYTGKIVEPELYDTDSGKGSIHVYLTAADKKKGIEQNASDYVRIVSYSNNIKAGVGKISLAGVDPYGGTRVVTFRIQKRGMLYSRAEKVILDSSNLPSTLLPGIEGKDRAVLTARVDPADTYNPTIVWTTSNASFVKIESVEVVEEAGVQMSKATLVAVGNGKAIIKATSQDTGKYAAVAVSSTKIAATSITLNKTALTLDAGATETLTYTANPNGAYTEKFVWSSSNTSVATVDANGVVTARHGGVAYISIKDMDPMGKNASARCILTVTEDISQMINVADECKLKTGDSTVANWNNNRFIEAVKQAAREDKTLYVPAGIYYFAAADSASNNSLRITDVSNVSVVLDKNAEIRAIPTSEGNSRVVWINNASNISITGGTIIGDLGQNGCVPHEDFHGIKIVGSSNVCISNVNVSNCCGDGIYIEKNSTNVEIINCTLKNCGRHCTSLVYSENVTFRNCTISNTRAGGCIDIEHGPNRHVRIIDCKITVGGEAAISVLDAASDVVVTGTTISGGGLVNKSCSSFSFNGQSVPIDPDGRVWYPK